MILLVTPARCAPACVDELQAYTGETVSVAQTLLEATTQLRMSPCKLVIFDQNLIEAEPNESETALAHLGDAGFLNVNFALTGMDRLRREVRCALMRRERTEAAAMSAAAQLLEGKLNETLAALLLDCENAAKLPNLTPDTAEKLNAIHAGTQQLRSQIVSATERGSAVGKANAS